MDPKPHPVWKIRYENGDTFTSEQGEPNDSPGWSVIAIAQPEVDYRDLVWGESYYIFRRDKGFWTGHDLGGVLDQFVHFSPEIIAFRVGRDTLTSTMKKAVAQMGVEMRGR